MDVQCSTLNAQCSIKKQKDSLVKTAKDVKVKTVEGF